MKVSQNIIEKKALEYLEKKEFEVISKACGAFFMFGEYSVMYQKLAIMMPIPMYVYLGVKQRKSAGIIIKLNLFDTKDIIGEQIELGPKAMKRLRPTISEFFPLDTMGIEIQAIFGFPSRVGLNSSGAMSAAMGLALQSLYDPKSCFFDTCETPIEELIQEGSFKNKFKIAKRIENVIHGQEGSGVGAFTSLVGSPNGMPVLYLKRPKLDDFIGYNLSEILDPDERPLLYNFLWKDSMFFAIFTNEERSHTKTAVHLEEFDNKIEETQKTLLGTEGLEKLLLQTDLTKMFNIKDSSQATHIIKEQYWKILQTISIYGLSSILKKDSHETRKAMDTYQHMLNFLELSTPKMDEVRNAMCARGFGVKITGSGRGGDLIVFAPNENTTHDFIKDNKTKIHFNSNDYSRKAQLSIQPATILKGKTACKFIVEGKCDEVIILQWLKKFHVNTNILIFHPIGAKIDIDRIRHIADDFPKIVIICDSDRRTKNYQISAEKATLQDAFPKYHVWITERREIENYLTPSIVEKHFKMDQGTISVGRYEDIKRIIYDEKGRRYKKNDALEIAGSMTREIIEKDKELHQHIVDIIDYICK